MEDTVRPKEGMASRGATEELKMLDMDSRVAMANRY